MYLDETHSRSQSGMRHGSVAANFFERADFMSRAPVSAREAGNRYVRMSSPTGRIHDPEMAQDMAIMASRYWVCL